MNERLSKPYDPQQTETRMYALWEESGYFDPDKCVADGVCKPDAEPFTIILPPPNVTGILHMGHAYEDALQDAVARFQRMRGKRTLWVPGTDSAAIATQARVEKNLQKEEKKSRYDLGREEFVRRVEEFAKNSESTILNQVRRIGSSLDWSRYAYTLDDARNKAVATAFKRMYDAGLIYRGNRIVNWDPKGQTTISDDEIVHEERTATLYTFKYWSDFPITIATTRPETKVGDTAVAVHPDDDRYKAYIDKEYHGEFAGAQLTIKIIADDSIDPEYGTGALGVTPAHSNTDWELAERHELPHVQVIDERARMTEEAGSLVAGLKTTEAREQIVAWLKEHDLLVEEEKVSQNVSISERTGAIVEPLPKLQWWVSVDTEFTLSHSAIPGLPSGTKTNLKELMEVSVSGGGISMPQEQFRKIYFHWINNLRDWCISRQIWFGHRIPVWYKGNEMYCGVEPPSEPGWEQDPDVLDTWFSSALWSFSTLGWPDETRDLAVYHPTSLMSPAYEILPLWVSRMILMSGFHLGEVPFRTVLIHGLVKDKHGRKFSKSLGNGVDPIEMIERHGADALRMGLLAGTAIGNDVKFDESKVKGYKHFANKLWNITRFILTNTDGIDVSEMPRLDRNETKSGTDQEIISAFDAVIEKTTEHFAHYRLHLAAEELHNYIWHTFADNIIEESKPIFQSGTEEDKRTRAWTLCYIWKHSLTMLHPFMPFVTEELWGIIHGRSDADTEEGETAAPTDLLMTTPWPDTASKQ